jgi:hypothetical protein
MKETYNITHRTQTIQRSSDKNINDVIKQEATVPGVSRYISWIMGFHDEPIYLALSPSP